MGILKKLFKQKQKTPEQFNSHAWSHLMLSGDIRDNISRLNEIMNHSSDLKSREFNLQRAGWIDDLG